MNPSPQPAEAGTPIAWKHAAQVLGEHLASVGPDGYYELTADDWLRWALSALSAPSGWISVKERPKKTGMYWTLRHTGLPSITEYVAEGDFCGWGDDISFWMPILPAPPKEGTL